MVFYPPEAVPKLPFDPPDAVPIHGFLFDEQYGRYPLGKSSPAFTDGLSGKSYSAQAMPGRIEALAKALQKRWNWSLDTVPNKPASGSGSNRKVDTSKVACVFTLNTVYYLHSLSTLSCGDHSTKATRIHRRAPVYHLFALSYWLRSSTLDSLHKISSRLMRPYKFIL